MRRNHVKLALAAIFAVPLGACNSFVGQHLFAHRTDASRPMRSSQTTNVDYSPLLDPATQSGRALLANGMPGSAIESFERALSAGEAVDPAINGLGIAYARLGRLDLAKRFFERAIAVDPGNDRYQDNLTLLLASPQYAADQHGNCAVQPIQAIQSHDQASTLAGRASKAMTAAAAIPGKLVRISRGEVYIVTAPALRAPILASASVLGSRATAGRRVPPNAHELRQFVPVVRIDLATSESGAAHPAGAKPQAPAAPSTRRTVIFSTTVGKQVAPNGAAIRKFGPVAQSSPADANSAIRQPVGARYKSLAVAGR